MMDVATHSLRKRRSLSSEGTISPRSKPSLSPSGKNNKSNILKIAENSMPKNGTAVPLSGRGSRSGSKERRLSSVSVDDEVIVASRTPTVSPRADSTKGILTRKKSDSSALSSAGERASPRSSKPELNGSRAGSERASPRASSSTTSRVSTRVPTSKRSAKPREGEAEDTIAARKPQRERKPVKFVIYEIGNTPTKPVPNKTKASNGDAAGESKVDKWEGFYRRLQHIFKRVRYLQAFVDTYEAAGWKSKNAEKAKPHAELLRTKKSIVELKIRMRELLREIDNEAADCVHYNCFPGKGPSTSRAEAGKFIPSLAKSGLIHGGNDDGIPAEDIGCSRCGDYEADDDNDILLCDYSGCGLALHMRCCDPPLEAPPPEEGDWLCRRCTCLVRHIVAINEEYELHCDRWDDFFEEADEELEDMNTEIAAWTAAEDIRRAPLRGSSRAKASTSDDDASDEAPPRRPLRAAAAAARIYLEHKAKKAGKMKRNGAGTDALGSPSAGNDELSEDDSVFEMEEEGGEDDVEESDSDSDGELVATSDSDDGAGATSGKRQRPWVEDDPGELSCDSDLAREEPASGGPVRSRRLAKKARVDFVALNKELFGGGKAGYAEENDRRLRAPPLHNFVAQAHETPIFAALLDDETDWEDK